MIGADLDRIALSIQQPWAELILRGIKTIEIRRSPARPRGTIYLYASQRFSRLPGVESLLAEEGISSGALPLGALVGTVEILGCRPACESDAAAARIPPAFLSDAYAWILGNPQRLPQPVQPRYVPFGTWFYPFQRLRTNTRQRRKDGGV
ncbi:ASCH domain-containing protein [Planctomicrobium sp. SH661]|uniref:ASCH domain-containing protein n=1 Tax=Planctomicrobium sp. SH661 TaxID=3448124 RepID=UPI003F5CB8E6